MTISFGDNLLRVPPNSLLSSSCEERCSGGWIFIAQIIRARPFATQGFLTMKIFSQSFLYECVNTSSSLTNPLTFPEQRFLVHRLTCILLKISQSIRFPHRVLRCDFPYSLSKRDPIDNTTDPQKRGVAEMGTSGNRIKG